MAVHDGETVILHPGDVCPQRYRWHIEMNATQMAAISWRLQGWKKVCSFRHPCMKKSFAVGMFPSQEESTDHAQCPSSGPCASHLSTFGPRKEELGKDEPPTPISPGSYLLRKMSL